MSSEPPEQSLICSHQVTKTSDEEDKDNQDNSNHEELNLALKDLSELPSWVLSYNNLVTLKLSYNNLCDLPLALCEELSALRHFIIKGNALRRLPDNIGLLTHLLMFDASENNIEKLPSSFVCLQRLETLKLVGNSLKQLPLNFHRLTGLQQLHLDENQVRKLPSTFGELHQLQRLDMNNNRLKALPDNFGSLTKLQYLDLSYNKLKTLPDSMKLLSSLEDLDLSHNCIKFFPEEFACASRLRKLYADNNQFGMLPSWFNQLESLEELSLEDNQFQNCPFPSDFGRSASKLKHFSLAANFMQALPDSFGLMTSLEYIHLGSTLHELERRNFQNGNWISKLPTSFGHLTLLKHLRLDENQLVELPESFGELMSLETLDLGQNKLSRLPENFGKLCSLRTCWLSKNCLGTLPQNFGELQCLVELKLDNNLLPELPESFNALTQLQTLDLFNNKLSSIPPCLQFMTCLRYLELDENDLGVSVEEIPRIFQNKSYPQNSKTKGNWRDRGRLDLDRVFQMQYEVHEHNEKMNGDIDSSVKMYEQSNNLLTALQQGSALWRSHGMDGERVKFEHNLQQTFDQQQQLLFKHKNMDTSCSDTTIENADVSMSSDDDDKSDSDVSEEIWCLDEDMNDINADPSDYTITKGDAASSEEPDRSTSPIIFEPEEDWDAEIEESNPFHVYDDFPRPGQIMNRVSSYVFHSRNTFCPADNHAKPILRAGPEDNNYRTIVGQFEDV